MAIRQCRWCYMSANGEIAIADHERQSHPKLYWEAKAKYCRAQAQRLIDEATRYEEQAKSETTEGKPGLPV